jgi:predicted lipid carrier protein YhbT
MTTEETLRAKIKLLECQLQVCKEENARLRKVSKIEAEFAENVRLALEVRDLKLAWMD